MAKRKVSKFKKLANQVARQYRKKGVSKKKAEEIGKAVAYKVGVKKYGKAGMKKKAAAGRKRARRK